MRFKERSDLKLFNEGQFEACFEEIACKKKNIVVGEIYRCPRTSEKDFISDYDKLISKITAEKKNVLIGTDQNFDYLKLHQHSNTCKFLETNLNLDLIRSICKQILQSHL